MPFLTLVQVFENINEDIKYVAELVWLLSVQLN